MTFFCYWEW